MTRPESRQTDRNADGRSHGSRSRRARPRPVALAGAAAFLVCALLAIDTVPARAQGSGYLFKPPVASVTLRGGFAFASAGSEVFTDPATIGQLTIDDSDFNSFALGADVGIRINPRFDGVLGVGLTRAAPRSEFRDYTDQDDLSIEQQTKFTRVPLTASLKYYVLPRGRQVGQLAWIPRRVAPYIGAGGGAIWYQFEQVGDFIDFVDLSVYSDRLSSSGWTPTAHVFGGIDFAITPRVAFSAEARYAWASAGMDRDFTGFDDIDLAGLRTTLGLSLRF